MCIILMRVIVIRVGTELTDPTVRSVASTSLERVMLKSPIRKKKMGGNILNKGIDTSPTRRYNIRGLREMS